MSELFTRFRRSVPTQSLATGTGSGGVDLGGAKDDRIKDLLAAAKLNLQTSPPATGQAQAQSSSAASVVPAQSPFQELLIPAVIAFVVALASLLPLAQWQNNILLSCCLFTICILWRLHVILAKLSRGFYPIKPREVLANFGMIAATPLILLFGLHLVLPCIDDTSYAILPAAFSIAAVYCLMRHDWQVGLSRVGRNCLPAGLNMLLALPVAFAIIGISSFADISNLRAICALCLMVGLADLYRAIKRCTRTGAADLLAEGLLGEWEGNGNLLVFFADGRADYLSILERRSIFSGAVSIRGQMIAIGRAPSQHTVSLVDLQANYVKTTRIPNVDQLRQKQLSNLGLLTEERRPSRAPLYKLPIIVPTIGNFISFADRSTEELNQHFAQLLMPHIHCHDSDLEVLSQPQAALLNFLQGQSSSVDPVWAMHKLVEWLSTQNSLIIAPAKNWNRYWNYRHYNKCEAAFFCAITYGASAIVQGRTDEVYKLFVEIGRLTEDVLGDYHELWAYSQWNIGWLANRYNYVAKVELAKEHIHKYVIGSPISIGSPVGEPGTRCLREQFHARVPHMNRFITQDS